MRNRSGEVITSGEDLVGADVGEGDDLDLCHARHPLRVLVIGASGFIGGRIVKALTASDWATPVAASRSGGARTRDPIEKLQLDVRDPAAVRAAIRGADAVVNCVAGDTDSIVSGARVLFESCAELTRQPRIVHLSTISVYGKATGIVDETAPLLGDGGSYSAAKSEAELLADDYGPVVFLRPGIVYGPGGRLWTDQIGQWLIAGRLGALGPAGWGCCNLVYVDDVAAATMIALRKPGIEGEAFNLSSPEAPTWNEYFRRFAGALGIPPFEIGRRRLLAEQFLLAAPLKAAQLAAIAVGLSWTPPAPIPPGLVRQFSNPLRLDAGKAERVLGIRWKPLEEGLGESAAWLKGTTPSDVRGSSTPHAVN
jgi:nucleoside-diphosphate-sugar epimerase